MKDRAFSDEQLHAFVDDQLDPADRRQLLEGMQNDADLRLRVDAIQQSKHLLHMAYQHPPPAPGRELAAPPAWQKAFALGAFLILGIGLGWALHTWQRNLAAPSGVVIQVSENDPAKWQMALLNARNVRKAYAEKDMGIEIVAYGPGLEMFRSDSVAAAGMEQAAREGVKLLACGNTMSMTQTPRSALSQRVDVVQAGVVEIMERQRDGYAYVRP